MTHAMKQVYTFWMYSCPEKSETVFIVISYVMQ